MFLKSVLVLLVTMSTSVGFANYDIEGIHAMLGDYLDPEGSTSAENVGDYLTGHAEDSGEVVEVMVGYFMDLSEAIELGEDNVVDLSADELVDKIHELEISMDTAVEAHNANVRNIRNLSATGGAVVGVFIGVSVAKVAFRRLPAAFHRTRFESAISLGGIAVGAIGGAGVGSGVSLLNTDKIDTIDLIDDERKKEQR